MFLVYLEDGKYIDVESDENNVIHVYNCCGVKNPVLLYEHNDIISVCSFCL